MGNFVDDGSHAILIVHADGTRDVCYTKSCNVPAGDAWAPWEPLEGDKIAHNYSIDDGKLVYNPTLSEKPTMPNLKGFAQAIQDDSSLTAQVRVGLGSLIGLLHGNIHGVEAYWKDMIEVHGNSWLTPEVQQKIIEHAKNNNINLLYS